MDAQTLGSAPVEASGGNGCLPCECVPKTDCSGMGNNVADQKTYAMASAGDDVQPGYAEASWLPDAPYFATNHFLYDESYDGDITPHMRREFSWDSNTSSSDWADNFEQDVAWGHDYITIVDEEDHLIPEESDSIMIEKSVHPELINFSTEEQSMLERASRQLEKAFTNQNQSSVRPEVSGPTSGSDQPSKTSRHNESLRRREQNRRAQRAFRARKEKAIHQLEQHVIQLQLEVDALRETNERLMRQLNV